MWFNNLCKKNFKRIPKNQLMLDSILCQQYTNHKPVVNVCQYLCCHDQLMVDHIVRGKAHPKESTGWVQVAGHPTTAVHILTNTLGRIEDGIHTISGAVLLPGFFSQRARSGPLNKLSD